MLALQARHGAIIIVTARIVHVPSVDVGSCVQDRKADEAVPRRQGADVDAASGIVAD
jgi:hypothetical protein